ncbi:MAG TPA: hypothetical protein VEI80_05990 [Candidatus Acidoferrales bacterium]|nr:hypothetical protein [Candidatus Acidoferrales bacterium]
MTDHDRCAKDEKRLLEVLSKGLSTEFRNPSRLGCPESAVLEGIALHRITLAEAEPWIDHLGSCSACFAEFNAIRKGFQTRRNIALGSTVGVLLAALALWFSQSHFAPVADDTAILDLRGYSTERGSQAQTKQTYLEMNRHTRHLILYLPMGTTEGRYELVLMKDTGDELLRTTGSAQLENHVTILKADIDLSTVPRDSCFLGVRLPDLDWVRFPVRVF